MRNVCLVDNVKNINTSLMIIYQKDPCASYLEKSASNPKGVLRCCQKNKQRGNQCDMKIIQSDYGDECLCRVYDDKMKREKIENEIRVLNQIEID